MRIVSAPWRRRSQRAAQTLPAVAQPDRDRLGASVIEPQDESLQVGTVYLPMRKQGKATLVHSPRVVEVLESLAAAVNYSSAGTVEFLVDNDTKKWYFLEMNTRLQVEHPITEMVTGVDLVKAQLRVAMGEPLWFAQEDLKQTGHAIELRIYAEDPTRNWAPSPGLVPGYREPGGPWVRVDSAMYAGAEVPVHYDPMVAKLVVWGANRADAIERSDRALREYRVRGIHTTIPFFRAILRDPDFISGQYSTAYLDAERMERLCSDMGEPDPTSAALAALVHSYERDLAQQSPSPDAGGDTNRWKWSYR
jgi:acetyl-CoA carboxylase biotin carboxylase subunit